MKSVVQWYKFLIRRYLVSGSVRFPRIISSHRISSHLPSKKAGEQSLCGPDLCVRYFFFCCTFCQLKRSQDFWSLEMTYTVDIVYTVWWWFYRCGYCLFDNWCIG